MCFADIYDKCMEALYSEESYADTSVDAIPFMSLSAICEQPASPVNVSGQDDQYAAGWAN